MLVCATACGGWTNILRVCTERSLGGKCLAAPEEWNLCQHHATPNAQPVELCPCSRLSYFFLCAKIQQAIGPHEDLTIAKKRKLQWYGHVSHSSGLAKTILQGTMKGVRRQGRQRKRWEDNIREWTGLEFGKSQRAMENREK